MQSWDFPDFQIDGLIDFRIGEVGDLLVTRNVEEMMQEFQSARPPVAHSSDRVLHDTISAKIHQTQNPSIRKSLNWEF